MEETVDVTGQEPAAPAETTEVSTPVEQTETPTETAEIEEPNPYLLELEKDENAPVEGEVKPTGEALKPFLEQSPYITNEAQLQGAIADSHLMWDIVNGQVPPGKLLEGLEGSNPQAWQGIVNGLAQYIQEKTGFQFVDPKNAPQSTEVDPVQARIDAIEGQFRKQEEAREQQVLTQRAVQSQGALMKHLESTLKGSFLEGEEASVLSQLGAKLGDPLKVIDAIEKGDFKAVEQALKAVKREEAERYNRYAQRVAKQRKAVASSTPGVDNLGTPAKPRAQAGYDLSTPEGRIRYANEFKG